MRDMCTSQDTLILRMEIETCAHPRMRNISLGNIILYKYISVLTYKHIILQAALDNISISHRLSDQPVASIRLYNNSS